MSESGPRLKPAHTDPDSCVAAAAGLFVAGDPGEGIRLLQHALTLDHRHVPALNAYARAQARHGSWSLAEEACSLALAEDPGDAAHLRDLAEILYDIDCVDASEATVDRAIRLRPDDDSARILKAKILRARGHFAAARAELLAVVERNPRALAAYPALAQLETFTADSTRLRAMRELVSEADPADPASASLHYALGKAHEDIGDHDGAFAHFATGARIKRAASSYDEPAMLAFFDEVIATFTRSLIEKRKLADAGDETRAVFIVGMPRSGSTLVERILASHPLASSEGERRSLAEHLALLAETSGPFPGLAERADRDALHRVARLYRSYIDARCAGRRLFISKLPGNFFFLGMIHILLPDARFLITVRDPLDNCLSIYRTLFAEDLGYSYDLGELGRHYRRFQALLAHWQDVVPPDNLRTVGYEELVADPERVSRELLAFAGLPWHDDCRRFFALDRPVRTASVLQVRQPIYQSSVGNWRRYRRHLQPLAEALGAEMP